MYPRSACRDFFLTSIAGVSMVLPREDRNTHPYLTAHLALKHLPVLGEKF